MKTVPQHTTYDALLKVWQDPCPSTWRHSGTKCACCTSTAPLWAAILSRANYTVQTRVNYDD